MTPPAGHGLRLPGAVAGLPAAFWWIWCSILVNWMGAFAGPLLILSLTLGRGYSAASAGLVAALLGLGGIVGITTGGVLADQIGRRRTMVAGHLWTAISMALLGLFEGHLAVSLAAFAVGLGSASVRPAAQASLVDLVPAADRQRAFALNYWALNAGISVSAVLAGLLVGRGYTLLFLADAAATLLCALVVLAKVPETHPARGPAAAVPGRRAPGIVRDRSFLVFVLMTLVFAAVFEQHAVGLPIVMTRDGHSAAAYSMLNVVNGVLVVALQIPLSTLAARRSRPAVLIVAGVLVGWGLGFTAFADGFAAYAAATVVWTVGEILQAPIGSAVTADRAPLPQRGRYQATYGLSWSVAAFIGPAAGGLVLDRWGSGALWSGCAVLGTAAGLGAALVVRHHQVSRATGPPVVGAGTDSRPGAPAPLG
ncbi:MFS transporter [Micromonospora sp. WMMD980]|uniref:MDR family MFS transporter n=1 Tax=Micromonospora sp. WMMD980 TaxID=3016088 RepID=UPI0024163AB8|nr:MFS transporter [Micromonospora sp. WMMD980]MDG4800208.1 MFS transporter [Micromonospora sp. WMMD980]